MSGELDSALKKRVDEYLALNGDVPTILDILEGLNHDERDAVNAYIERRKAGESTKKYCTIASQTETTQKLDESVKKDADREMSNKR